LWRRCPRVVLAPAQHGWHHVVQYLSMFMLQVGGQ
jgi:hypothetical protein